MAPAIANNLNLTTLDLGGNNIGPEGAKVSMCVSFVRHVCVICATSSRVCHLCVTCVSFMSRVCHLCHVCVICAMCVSFVSREPECVPCQNCVCGHNSCPCMVWC